MNERAWHVAVEALARDIDSKQSYIDYCERRLKEATEVNDKLELKIRDLEAKNKELIDKLNDDF